MKRKPKVWIVQPNTGSPYMDTITKRLIRGTLKEVEQKLRGEVSIEPCTAEQAHELAAVEIESAEQE